MRTKQELQTELDRLSKELFDIQLNALEIGLTVDMDVSSFDTEEFGIVSTIKFIVSEPGIRPL